MGYFFDRFAVCRTCIAIDENIRKAGTNERDRKLWQRAKKEHRDYVSQRCFCPSCNVSLKSVFTPLLHHLFRYEWKEECTCTGAATVHSIMTVCTQQMMGQIKQLLDYPISLKLTKRRLRA